MQRFKEQQELKRKRLRTGMYEDAFNYSAGIKRMLPSILPGIPGT